MVVPRFHLKNSNLTETDEYMLSNVEYCSTEVVERTSELTCEKKAESQNKVEEGRSQTIYCGDYEVRPVKTNLQVKTMKKVPKTGVMLVGLGGNNGTTLVGILLANKHNLCWETKRGVMKPNYYGSLLKSSTMNLGTIPTPDETGTFRELCVPLCDVVPMLDPNNLEVDGWDISSMNLADAMKRAQVFDSSLQSLLKPYMENIKPRKSIFNSEFVASNQSSRADNVLTGTWDDQINQIRSDIRDFKNSRNLEKVIVLWTASTERFSDVEVGVNDTAENLLRTVKKNDKSLVAPSTLYAIASVLEGCDFINGSPQNTLVPGLIDLASLQGVHLAGDDFKTGQTKIKSALVEFLINSGIKPMSIVSYNHLGNNDGHNLNAPPQFRSKEITKSGVIEDMVSSNPVLYEPGENPDHCIVIKYVPFVGDSKRAMDEYTSEICMHGLNTISIHNTCEDSLLAVPVILDLIIMCELSTRISLRKVVSNEIGVGTDFESFDTILSILSFLLKAPLSNPGEPSVNAFARQRNSIINLIRMCVGLPPENHLFLENKVPAAKLFR